MGSGGIPGMDSAWSLRQGLGQGHSRGPNGHQSPLTCRHSLSVSMPFPRTSTDDSPRRKMGARVTSGSLWKMLGLAWCWKWRKFHQWAEKPCGGQMGLSEVQAGHTHLAVPALRHSVSRPHPAPGCPPPTPTLTFSCPITNCWATWFHRDFLKTGVWPRSCCRHQHWAWGEMQGQECLGGSCLGSQPASPPSSQGTPTAEALF